MDITEFFERLRSLECSLTRLLKENESTHTELIVMQTSNNTMLHQVIDEIEREEANATQDDQGREESGSEHQEVRLPGF